MLKCPKWPRGGEGSENFGTMSQSFLLFFEGIPNILCCTIPNWIVWRNLDRFCLNKLGPRFGSKEIATSLAFECIFNWESLNNKNGMILIVKSKIMYLNSNSTSRPTVPSSLTSVWISRIYNALILPGRGLWHIESESFLYNL